MLAYVTRRLLSHAWALVIILLLAQIHLSPSLAISKKSVSQHKNTILQHTQQHRLASSHNVTSSSFPTPPSSPLSSILPSVFSSSSAPPAVVKAAEGQPKLIQLILLGKTRAALKSIAAERSKKGMNFDAVVTIDKTSHDNPIDGGMTALDVAAYTGNIAVVKALLVAGADMSHVNRHSLNAVSYACAEGSVELVEEFLHSEGSPQPEGAVKASESSLGPRALNVLGRAGIDGQNPLSIAVKAGNTEVALYLLSLPIYNNKMMKKVRHAQ